MKISVRQIAIAGILLALSAILVNTPLGMIPVPTPAQYATIMHIPVIIVGILEGPLMGGIVGFLFGILALLKVPAFGPIVHIVPRIFVGVIPALVYSGITKIFKKDSYEPLAISISAVAGSLTNTVGCLGLGLLLMPKLMPLSAAITIALTAGLPEAFFAVIISIPIVMALKKHLPSKSRQATVPKN